MHVDILWQYRKERCRKKILVHYTIEDVFF